MGTKNVAVLVGSLRKESFCRKMAKVLKELAPPSLNLEEIELGNLEIYNQDFDDENNPPASWVKFRQQMKKYDAVLFVIPEYNRSVSAVIKNALDVGSRPMGESIWNGKPGAIVSVSPGAMGAFGANHHLRQSLVFLNIPTMQQPEAYIGNAATLFDDKGRIINEGTKQFLQKIIDGFDAWVGNF
jgi:chromate reductase